MATEIDSLQIELNASATKANDAIDKLVKKLDILSDSLSKINSSGLSGLASGVDRLGTAMQSMKNIRSNEFTRLANNIERLSKVDVSSLNNTANTISNLTNAFSGIGAISNNSQQLGILSTNLSTLARGIRSFGNINSSNLSSIATTLTPLANGITVLSNVNFNNRNLQNLINSLTRLSNANVSGLSNVNFSQLGNSIGQLATSLQNAPHIHQSIISMTNAISNLSESGQNISVVSANLTGLGNSLRRFMSDIALAPSVSDNTISFSQAIATLANAGNRAGTTASNLSVLGSGLRDLIITLSTAPNVSRNIIDLTNALANLASQGGRVGNASNRISSGLNMASASAARAKKSFNGLAGAIGKFYATYFLAIRGIKGLWKSVESSMDYIETLNYFNKSFEQVAEKADLGSWEQLGHDSAEAYYNSFAERAEELTAKLSGYAVSESGMLLPTEMPSLGINPAQVMQYQAMFGQMASSMGVTSETALQLSNILTMIGSDLASVRNMDFDKVWTDMASGLAGMSRTLDKYGVNIRNVNLQQKLNELGIQANIQSLNQNEKALLRTIILLDSTRYAWGDLAETINQPANQLRLLKANFENLARTIGNIFLPIVAKVLPYINGLVIALQRLAQFIVNLLGFEGFDWGGVSGSSVDVNELLGLEDATDNLAAANKEAEKLKKTTLGIDELNINAPEESGADSGVGSFSGIDVGLQDALSDIMGEYQSKWDEAFAEMENRANEFADKIEKAFEPVKKLFKDIAIGDWFAVGQDVNIIATNILDFFSRAIDEVNWGKLGENIGDFLRGLEWEEILVKAFELKFNIWKAIAEAWFRSLDAAPIETAILTAIGLLKFTGLGEILKNKILQSIIGAGIGDATGTTIGSSILGSLGKSWTSLGGLKGILTTDLKTLLGAGTIKEIGLTIGTGLATGIAAAIAGFGLGKVLGKAIFGEEFYEYYDNFKWFGDSGFFSEISDDWEITLEAMATMATDLVELPIQKTKEFLKESADEVDLFSRKMEEVIPYMLQMGTIWQDSWRNSTEKVGKELETGIANMGQKADSGLSELGNMIQKKTDKITDDWQVSMDFLETAMNVTIGTLNDDGETGINNLVSIVNNGLDLINAGFSEKTNSINTIVNNGLNLIKNSWQEKTSEVNTIWQTGMDSITLGTELGMDNTNSMLKLKTSAMNMIWNKNNAELSKSLDSTVKSSLSTLESGITKMDQAVEKETLSLIANVSANLAATGLSFGSEMQNIDSKMSETTKNTEKMWNESLKIIRNSIVTSTRTMLSKTASGMNGVISGFENVLGEVVRNVNKLIKDVNGNLGKFISAIPLINFVANFKRVTIPQYAMGGFPEDGLFMANHSELVGQFTNGKTAVANNEMIVAGIEEAAYRGFTRAYSENNREANLLEELIVAVREGKDIQIDGRSLVQAYDDRKARNGYVFG